MARGRLLSALAFGFAPAHGVVELLVCPRIPNAKGKGRNKNPNRSRALSIVSCPLSYANLRFS
jgi:hypothetical protein